VTLALLLLVVAAIIFAVDAWLHKSLIALGLAVFMLSLILGAGLVRL
jgi:hypothetical protein